MDYGITDSLIIRNSNFTFNTVGLYATGGYVLIDSCTISNNVNEGVYKFDGTLSNSTISHNQTGIFAPSGTVLNCTIEYNQIGLNVAAISILSCKIRYNQTGVISLDDRITINNCIVDSNTADGIIITDFNNIISNSEIKYNNGSGITTNGNQSVITKCNIENNLIGINENGIGDSIYCNKICNNTDYDFKYSKASGSNISLANNYWCTTDSLTITSQIYDGYDNISLGLVSFLPIDTLECYLFNDVPLLTKENTTFTIYPNPTQNHFTIKLNSELQNARIEVYNLVGEIVYSAVLFRKEQNINETFPSGIYFVKVADGEKQFVEKLIVQ